MDRHAVPDIEGNECRNVPQHSSARRAKAHWSHDAASQRKQHTGGFSDARLPHTTLRRPLLRALLVMWSLCSTAACPAFYSTGTLLPCGGPLLHDTLSHRKLCIDGRNRTRSLEELAISDLEGDVCGNALQHGSAERPSTAVGGWEFSVPRSDVRGRVPSPVGAIVPLARGERRQVRKCPAAWPRP